MTNELNGNQKKLTRLCQLNRWSSDDQIELDDKEKIESQTLLMELMEVLK